MAATPIKEAEAMKQRLMRAWLYAGVRSVLFWLNYRKSGWVVLTDPDSGGKTYFDYNPSESSADPPLPTTVCTYDSDGNFLGDRPVQ
jgi:hypothetical protein